MLRGDGFSGKRAMREGRVRPVMVSKNMEQNRYGYLARVD